MCCHRTYSAARHVSAPDGGGRRSTPPRAPHRILRRSPRVCGQAGTFANVAPDSDHVVVKWASTQVVPLLRFTTNASALCGQAGLLARVRDQVCLLGVETRSGRFLAPLALPCPSSWLAAP
eukprot:1600743-Rhodomonas_salina.1